MSRKLCTLRIKLHNAKIYIIEFQILKLNVFFFFMLGFQKHSINPSYKNTLVKGDRQTDDPPSPGA